MKTLSTTRLGKAQQAALTYIMSHPGCSILEVDTNCRTARGGHKWMYESVHRLIKRGLVVAHFSSGKYHLTAAEGLLR